MAGWDTLNGAASSATVASPSVSRVKIARLVGSASAPNTRLSRSGAIHNHLISKLDGYIVASAVPVVNPAAGLLVSAGLMLELACCLGGDA
jgi:hypothetical protein